MSKLVLFLLCRSFGQFSSSVRTLALDHRNDVLSNIVAIICGYLGKIYENTSGLLNSLLLHFSLHCLDSISLSLAFDLVLLCLTQSKLSSYFSCTPSSFLCSFLPFNKSALQCLPRIFPEYWDRNPLASNVDPDETQENVASDQGLQCLPLIKYLLTLRTGPSCSKHC